MVSAVQKKKEIKRFAAMEVFNKINQVLKEDAAESERKIQEIIENARKEHRMTDEDVVVVQTRGFIRVAIKENPPDIPPAIEGPKPQYDAITEDCTYLTLSR